MCGTLLAWYGVRVQSLGSRFLQLLDNVLFVDFNTFNFVYDLLVTPAIFSKWSNQGKESTDILCIHMVKLEYIVHRQMWCNLHCR